jgi:hypothetical protein
MISFHSDSRGFKKRENQFDRDAPVYRNEPLLLLRGIM